MRLQLSAQAAGPLALPAPERIVPKKRTPAALIAAGVFFAHG
jgi:hypothetical protein